MLHWPVLEITLAHTEPPSLSKLLPPVLGLLGDSAWPVARLIDNLWPTSLGEGTGTS